MSESMYTMEDIPQLKERLKEARKRAKEEQDRDTVNNWGQRESSRLKKLISLIEHRLNIEDYGSGTVLINEKFVVSLISPKWRVKGKSIWYNHKHDIKHFVHNYLLKEEFQSIPTPEQELDYFEARLKKLLQQKPAWLIREIREALGNERTDI